jgi:Mn2+/Fe2+ NRAMP family transporter
MSKVFEIALGIVTSVGGFLEVGSIATAAQGGAMFGLRLTWAIALGGLCVIFLVEMAGRFAAVSRHTIVDAMRERFGFNFFVLPLTALTLVNFLVLAAEIGGVCIALELATGVALQWWALPVAFAVWLLLWKGTFGVIEKGVSMLGLVTIVFIVGALKLHPSFTELGANLLPTPPGHDASRYWFLAVSILGASITPYLFYFYSSGAIEDEWDEQYIPMNRAIASLGMGFGSVISLAVLVVAALLLQPRGMQVEHYTQLPLLLTPLFGFWGYLLFTASLGVACFGAALEISLATAYMIAQGFGWNWGENKRPQQAARFSLAYTVTVFLASLLMAVGVDPLKLTNLSMALTAATLPLATVPFLALMNDEQYVKEHRNGWFSNVVVLFIILVSGALAVVTIPLEILGG